MRAIFLLLFGSVLSPLVCFSAAPVNRAIHMSISERHITGSQVTWPESVYAIVMTRLAGDAPSIATHFFGRPYPNLKFTCERSEQKAIACDVIASGPAADLQMVAAHSKDLAALLSLRYVILAFHHDTGEDVSDPKVAPLKELFDIRESMEKKPNQAPATVFNKQD